MKEKKVIKILKKLEKGEIKEVGNFIKYKFQNKENQIIKLFKLLVSHHPHYYDTELSEKKLHKKIFYEKKYSSSDIDNLYLRLGKILEEYLAYSAYRADRFQNSRNLLRQLLSRNLPDLFDKAYQKELAALNSEEVLDEIFYAKNYFIKKDYFEYLEDRLSIEKAAEANKLLLNQTDDLLHFFLISMLRNYTKLFMNEQIVKYDYRFRFLDDLLKHMDTELKHYKSVPLIILYHGILKIYSNPQSPENFIELKNLIVSVREKIAFRVYQDLMIGLYNTCVRQEKNGKSEYKPQTLSLAKQMAEEGVFLEDDGSMLDHNYTNIFFTATRCGDLDWGFHFLEKFKHLLPKRIREQVYAYNSAVYLYMKSKSLKKKEKNELLGKAIKILSEISLEHSTYYTHIKSLQLNIYLGTGDDISALETIDAFRHWIKRNEMLPQHLLVMYTNYLNFSERLLRCLSNESKVNISELENEIISTEQISYKSILLQKLEEIKNKN
jgi:hypothetical protein